MRIVRWVALLLLPLQAACTDPSYEPRDLSTEAQAFLLKAESVGALGSAIYLYPANEYPLIAKDIVDVLRADFRTVDAKPESAGQIGFQTEDVLFQRKTDHKKHCKGYVKSETKLGVVLVNVNCEVHSYWTRWKRPPTHSPGDWLDWHSDYYYDKQASLIESIKVQEALREKLGYAFNEVLRTDQPLFGEQAIQALIAKSGRPWCARGDAGKQLPECK
jgi:hypothetical protein